MRHLQDAARHVEALYQQQTGVTALRAQLKPGDTASAAIFQRNQGPDCHAPSVLAGIQLHFFVQQGAITYHKEQGKFTIHFDRMRAAANTLMSGSARSRRPETGPPRRRW